MDGHGRRRLPSVWVAHSSVEHQQQQRGSRVHLQFSSSNQKGKKRSPSPSLPMACASASGSSGTTVAFARSRLVRLLWRPSGAGQLARKAASRSAREIGTGNASVPFRSACRPCPSLLIPQLFSTMNDNSAQQVVLDLGLGFGPALHSPIRSQKTGC